jgi:parallel beta-helix repeat protein
MSRNGEAGIVMEKSDGFHIRHNRLVRNYAGILLGPASDNVITRNHISHGSCSLIARRPNGCLIDGIRIDKGHGNLVAHTTSSPTLTSASTSDSSAAPTTESAAIWSGTAARTGSVYKEGPR